MTTQRGIAELKVGGNYYGGWTALSITRSIEQIAGTFNLDLTERWPGSAELRAIHTGDACQVLIDGLPVITGYVDDVEIDYDAQSHSVRIAGRDKTGDLVDCSAIHKTGQWHNAKLEQIARDLLKPFGIGLKVQVDTGKALSSWNIEEGETVFECLSRAARMKAVLLVSDAEGNLVITRASSIVPPGALIEGRNIESASGRFTAKDRYSAYVTKGQGKGSDDWYGSNAAQPAADVRDAAVSRYRPLVVLAEDHANNVSLRDRAEWERNVRNGRGARASITVSGWYRSKSALWMPNTLVTVTSPSLSIDDLLLIVGCTWRLDERGTVTQIAVSRPEAFDLLANVSASRLKQKMFEKEQKERGKKGENWKGFQP